MIDALLQRKDIDVNLQNNIRYTALMSALSKQDVKSAKKLIDHKDIEVNLKNRHRETALIMALKMSSPNKDLVKKLLNKEDIEVNLNNKQLKEVLKKLKESKQPLDSELFRLVTEKGNEQNVSKPYLKKYIERAKTIKDKDISEDLKISFVDLIHQLSKLNAQSKYSELMIRLLEASRKLPETNSNSANINQDLIDFAKSCLQSIDKFELAKHTNWPEVVFKCVLAFFVFPVFIYLLATKRLLKSDFAIVRDKFIDKLKDIESNHSTPKP
jgi:hypothetical protein